ncbi:MAG: polyprenol monophosphomannose synthase [Microbacteriaceae bacterium]|nr:polyprenol monophosphomannose synthase [Microbacteriaceae bacterium]
MTRVDSARVIVVIPSFNEAESLERTIRALHAEVPTASVLVVDDDSPDGTGEIADRLAAADARIDVLHRPVRDGLGHAYLAGFARALDEGFDTIVEMDADGSHPADALPAMLAALHDADLVIGSRWVAGGSVRNWPRYREWLSRAANAYARVMLHLPVRDATAGYRAFRAQTLRAIDLEGVVSRGYCFQVDLTRRVVEAGLRVREVPIRFTDRIAGRSKMSGAIVIEAMLRVTGWGVARMLRPRRAG